MEDNQQIGTTENKFNFEAGQTTLQQMVSIGKWSKFMAIVMFVSMAIVFFCGIAAVCSPQIVASQYGFDNMVIGKIVGVVYIVMAIVYLFPAFFLLKNADAMRCAGQHGSQEQFAEAMRYGKRYWKFCGIFLIVALGLCALMIPAAIIYAVIIAM